MSGLLLLALEEIFLALCTICLLHRYADVKNLNKVILLCVGLAWFLSLNVILLLPLDVSVALYEQCLGKKNHTVASPGAVSPIYGHSSAVYNSSVAASPYGATSQRIGRGPS